MRFKSKWVELSRQCTTKKKKKREKKNNKPKGIRRKKSIALKKNAEIYELQNKKPVDLTNKQEGIIGGIK